MVLPFVDIGGIVDDHCLNFLSIIYFCMYHYIYVNLYICITLYKRLEASDNHTIYLSHWISKLL